MAKLIVTTSVPGRRRGGAQFTGTQSFAPKHFTAEQLAQIIADPVLSVTYGEIVTDAVAFLASIEPKERAAK